MKWGVSWSVHLCKSMYVNEYQFQCIGNDGDKIMISKFVPVGPLRYSHENRKTNECQSVKTWCANNKLKVTVSWNVIAVDKTLVSLLRAGIKMTVYRVVTWRIPDQRKSSKCCHQWAKGSALSFCDRKGVILLDLLKVTQIIATWCWLSWGTLFPWFKPKKKRTFFILSHLSIIANDFNLVSIQKSNKKCLICTRKQVSPFVFLSCFLHVCLHLFLLSIKLANLCC